MLTLKKHGIWILVSLFAAWFSVFSIVRHMKLESFMFDLGYYDQLVWLVAHGKPLMSSVIEMHPWIDHFSPSIFLLSPIYLLVPSPLVLLVSQAILISLGAVPIFYLSLKKTSNYFFSYSVSFSYLMFWGIHNAIAFDFHPLALGAPIFAFMIYFYEKQKWILFWLAIIVFAGLQENYLIFLVAFGIFLIFKYRDFLQGLLLSMFAGLTFFIIIFYGIPKYFHTSYSYLPDDSNYSLTNLIAKTYTPSEKTKVLSYSFGAFSFLPVLSPSYLLLFIEEYGGRFLVGNNPNWWSLGYQYNALSGALLAVSSIEVVSRFKKKSFLVAPILIISSIYTFWKVNPDTLRVFDKNFFDVSAAVDAKRVLGMVPPEASVAAANNLGAQIAERQEIYFITNCLKGDQNRTDGKVCLNITPDYLVADISKDANWNDFVYSFDRTSVSKLFDEKIKSGEYEVTARSGDTYLLHHVRKINE